MKKCMYKIYTYVCILFTQNTNLKYKQISNFIIAYNTIYPQILDSKLRSIVNHGIDRSNNYPQWNTYSMCTKCIQTSLFPIPLLKHLQKQRKIKTVLMKKPKTRKRVKYSIFKLFRVLFIYITRFPAISSLTVTAAN